MELVVQDTLCEHENIEEEVVVNHYFDPHNFYKHTECVKTIYTCLICGKELG